MVGTGSAPSPASIGQLWYLQGSPWSVRVRWIMALCDVNADLRSYQPFIDAFALWRRLGFPLRGPNLSVPVLFPMSPKNQRPLRSSVDIAKYVAAAAGEEHLKKLFPKEYETEAARLIDCADRIQEYGRSQMNMHLKANPDIAVGVWLPRKARGLFVAKPIVRLALWLFGRKYPSSSREAFMTSLNSVRSAIQSSTSGYLCGKELTFADICVACAIYFGMDFGRNLPGSDAVAQEFPDVVDWKNKIFTSHFIGSEAEVFSFSTRTKDQHTE